MPGKHRAKTEFGRWLDRQLDHLDMNMSGLARKIGVSQSAVSDWRQGRYMPTDENVRAMAAAMHVPVEDIYRALGVITDDAELPEDVRQILEMLKGMPPSRRRVAAATIRAMREEQDSERQERGVPGLEPSDQWQ
jgi:transcriptional regulator with XRE-family HTH domain